MTTPNMVPMKIPEPKFLIVGGRAIVIAAEKNPASSPAHTAMFELRSMIRSKIYPVTAQS